jgi:SAM-dependent methyltransferase
MFGKVELTMGISHHPFHFLLYAMRKKPLDSVLTLGRQNLFCAEFVVRERLKIVGKYQQGVYCEDLLKYYMSASEVKSIDNSDFEGATYVHDMNKPIPEFLKFKFDTVIDSGTTEHVFNVPQALMNCSEFCKPGGQILHISPANNLCGHGFWQFSPELFFSLYCEENGYEETEVFVADITNFRDWARVRKPENGQRAIINSSTPLYVMARTRKN